MVSVLHSGVSSLGSGDSVVFLRRHFTLSASLHPGTGELLGKPNKLWGCDL